MRGTRSRRVLTILGAVALGFGVTLASAGKADVAEGEVIAVHRDVVAADGQRYDEVTVQTRAREQVRLRLGPAGEEPPGVQEGQRIRARLMAGEPENGAYRVRTMRNYNTGEKAKIRNADGSLVRTRERTRARDGSCDGVPDRVRSRDRKHRSGTDAGTGHRAGRGGSSGRGRAR